MARYGHLHTTKSYNETVGDIITELKKWPECTAWDIPRFRDLQDQRRIDRLEGLAVKRTHPDAGGRQEDFERVQKAAEALGVLA